MKKSITIATLIVSGTLLMAPASFAGEVGRRQINQQKRIAEGIESGQLTPRETATLEKQEARLQAEKVDMKEDNGGRLTKKDVYRLNKQENRLSHEIYRDKHNRRHF